MRHDACAARDFRSPLGLSSARRPAQPTGSRSRSAHAVGETAGGGARATKDPSSSSELVVGIDLGTTNSAVARIVNGTPVCIPNADGEALTPSVVGGSVQGAPVPPARRRSAAARWQQTATACTAHGLCRHGARSRLAVACSGAALVPRSPPASLHSPAPPPTAPAPPLTHLRPSRSVPAGRRHPCRPRRARPAGGHHLLLSQAPHRAPGGRPRRPRGGGAPGL
jgi:hypothetical protein